MYLSCIQLARIDWFPHTMAAFLIEVVNYWVIECRLSLLGLDLGNPYLC